LLKKTAQDVGIACAKSEKRSQTQMLLDQIVEKQRAQIIKLKQTPIGNLRKEINDLRDKVHEQGKTLKLLSKQEVEKENTEEFVEPEIFTAEEEYKYTEADKEMMVIIREALGAEIPVMPAKMTPEATVKTLGLPIPLELRGFSAYSHQDWNPNTRDIITGRH
jgi:hypothetical protein